MSDFPEAIGGAAEIQLFGQHDEGAQEPKLDSVRPDHGRTDNPGL